MKSVKRGTALLLCMMLLAILAVVLLAFENTAFFCRRDYLLTQPVMLTAGMGALALLCVLLLCVKSGRRRAPKWAELLPWLALLAMQLVLCFYAYFITGWDVRGIVETAYALAGGEADMHIGYLSQYPNNISLVLVFAAIIRALRLLLGNPGLDRCIYVLIAFQCVLSTCTGFLLRRAAEKTMGSRQLSWCAALVYVGFVGLSPWLMIPYSDSVALIFPTAILTLYAWRDDERLDKWVWPVVGVFSGVGYMIKPQVLIAAIAIAIVETARCMMQRKPAAWLRRTGLMTVILVLLAGPGMQGIIKAAPIEIRPGRSMNMLHYVMMGLNQETNGSYLYDDVALTYNAEDKRAQQLPVIRERLENMGVQGFAEHLKKKTLTNYADGTFAWSCEGEFYREWIADKDAHISPFLKSIIYTGGSRYPIYQTAAQCVWLVLLVGCAFFALCQLIRRDCGTDEAAVMMLCIIGITLFQTVFEARARYLYIYAPFFVLLGVSGIWQTVQAVLNRCGIRAGE